MTPEQAGHEERPRPAGVEEGDRREPQRPHGEPGRRLVRTRPVERPPDLDQSRQGGVGEERGPRERADSHQHGQAHVERGHESLGDAAGPTVAEQHRQRPCSLRRIPLGLVDVLAHEDGGAQQAIGDRSHEHVPGQVAHRRVVRAAHHQRAPDREHVGLTEPALLQPQGRRRVGRAQEEPAQGEGHDRPAPVPEQHDEDGEVGDVDRQGCGQQPAPGDHPREHRVGRVQRAWVRARVGPDLEVDQIVHLVVGDVGQEDAGQGQEEQAGPKTGLVHRQQPGHGAGRQGHG